MAPSIGQIVDSNCVFFDPYSGERLILQHGPKRIEDNQGTEIKSVMIPGSSFAREVPVSATSRVLMMDLEWVATDPEERDTEWVRDQVNWIQARTYARIVDREIGIKKQTPIFMKIGKLLELPVYVERCQAVYGPFQNIDLLPILARAKLTWKVAPPKDFIDVLSAKRGRQFFRSWEVEETGRTLSFVVGGTDDPL